MVWLNPHITVLLTGVDLLSVDIFLESIMKSWRYIDIFYPGLHGQISAHPKVKHQQCSGLWSATVCWRLLQYQWVTLVTWLTHGLAWKSRPHLKLHMSLKCKNLKETYVPYMIVLWVHRPLDGSLLVLVYWNDWDFDYIYIYKYIYIWYAVNKDASMTYIWMLNMQWYTLQQTRTKLSQNYSTTALIWQQNIVRISSTITHTQIYNFTKYVLRDTRLPTILSAAELSIMPSSGGLYAQCIPRQFSACAMPSEVEYKYTHICWFSS